MNYLAWLNDWRNGRTDSAPSTDGVQQRLMRYLLQQTVGRLLAGGVDWDGLDMQLSAGGQLALRDVELNAAALNRALGQSADADGSSRKRLPLRVASGRIGRLRAVLPWTSFLAEPCALELEDVDLQLVPADAVASAPQEEQQSQQARMMSSSFHFADGFLRTELTDDESESPPLSTSSNATNGLAEAAGLADLAKIIENILGRATVSVSRLVCTIKPPGDANLVRINLDQLSLCDHTTDDVQRSIPQWLWAEQESANLNQIFKFLKLSGLLVSVVPTSEPDPPRPLIHVPDGWLRILFKQDSIGNSVASEFDMNMSAMSASSILTIWAGGVEIACDLERIGILVHDKTADNVKQIFEAIIISSNPIVDTPVQTIPQNLQTNMPIPAAEPLSLTLRIGAIVTCLLHPNERLPTAADIESLTVKRQSDTDIDDDHASLNVPHIRLDLRGFALKLQHHVSGEGHAVGIDIALDSILLRFTGDPDSENKFITLLNAIPSFDVPDPSHLRDFLLQKIQPPRASTGFTISQEDTLSVRIEGFKHAVPADASSRNGSSPWSYNVSSVLPPLFLSISTATMPYLQQYANGYMYLFSRSTSGTPTQRSSDAKKQESDFSISCPFFRIAVQVCPPDIPQDDLVHAIVDVFSARIVSPDPDKPTISIGPEASAGFVMLSLTTDKSAKTLRPLVLMESVRLDLAAKRSNLVPSEERLEEIISSLHRLYRDNAPTVEDIAARSWSDIGDESGQRGGWSKIPKNAPAGLTSTETSKFWADTRSKHRRNHPFAALSETVFTMDCNSFDVHVSDTDLPFVRRIIAQAQALSASQQEVAPFPRAAALFMSATASFKLTLHSSSGQTRRVDLSTRELDAIVALGSVGKSRNLLALEVISGELDLALQRFLIDTEYHEQTIVCNPTIAASAAPMLRLVFSQVDDFDIGVRQNMTTTIMDRAAVHLPVDASDFTTWMSTTLNMQAAEPPSPQSPSSPTLNLESFTSIHFVMTNFQIVHVSSQPFRGTSLVTGGRLRIATNIVPSSPTLLFDVSLTDGCISISLNADASVLLSTAFSGLTANGLSDFSISRPPAPSSTESMQPVLAVSTSDMEKHLFGYGFVRIAQVDLVRLLVRINSSGILPASEIDLTVGDVRLDVFPDSLSTVLGYFDVLEQELKRSFAPKSAKTHEHSPRKKNPVPEFFGGAESINPVQHITNIFDQVDENAFEKTVSAGDPSSASSDVRSHRESHLIDHHDDSDTIDHDWQTNFESVPALVPGEYDDDAVAAGILSEPVTDTVRSMCGPDGLNIDHGYLDRIAKVVMNGQLSGHDAQSPKLPQSTFLLRECNVVCRLYEGSHWDYERTRLSRPKRDHGGDSELLSPSDSSDLSIGSDYESFVGMGIGVGVSASSSDAGRLPNPNVNNTPGTDGSDENRKQEHELELRFVRVAARLDTFANHDADRKRELDVSVRDIEIVDNVKTSQWRKFFTYMQPEGNMLPRETGSDMLSVWMRWVPQYTSGRFDSVEEEVRMQATLLPFRMYIDQDTLKFAIRFVSETSNLRPPSAASLSPKQDHDSNSPNQSIFFQLCEIDPIRMKVDYKPKHVDFANLKDGHLIEILNFISLDSAELSLHRVRLAGVTGWGSLSRKVLGIWVPYIRDTQVPHVASGVSPVRPLVNVGAGLADLVLLPVEQFQRDGRIVKGLQKGTGSFLRAATMETIRLGSRLAAGTQIILERAEEFVAGGVAVHGTPIHFGSGVVPENFDGDRWADDASSVSGYTGAGSSVAGGSRIERRRISKFAEQPRDIREGLQMGYASLSEGVRSAARTIFAVPMEVYETNEEGRVHPVVRAVPVAILQPIIGATDAVSKTLVGLQNTLDRTQQKRMEDKYKRPN